jgi:hypothetical protein
MMSELVSPNPDVTGNTPNPTQPSLTSKHPLESVSAGFLKKDGVYFRSAFKKEYSFYICKINE